MTTTYFLQGWVPSLAREAEVSVDRPISASGENKGAATAEWAPSADLIERQSDVAVEFDLPGVDRNSIDLTVENGLLFLRAERKPSADELPSISQCRERPQGAFLRTVALPEKLQLDRVEASYVDGVLRVVFPKSPETQPRKITISSAGALLGESRGESPATD